MEFDQFGISQPDLISPGLRQVATSNADNINVYIYMVSMFGVEHKLIEPAEVTQQNSPHFDLEAETLGTDLPRQVWNCFVI